MMMRVFFASILLAAAVTSPLLRKVQRCCKADW